MDITPSDQKVSLVINKMTKAVYDEMKLSGLINDNELYCVEDPQIDAHQHTIENVANPINSNDAATKGYVDKWVCGNMHHAEFQSISLIPEQYTDETIKNTINEIISILKNGQSPIGSDMKHSEFSSLQQIPLTYTDQSIRNVLNDMIRILKGQDQG